MLDQVVGLEREGAPSKPTRARRKPASQRKRPPAAGDANRQLLAAARNGDPGAVEAALSQGAAVDNRDEYGDTVLNQAAEWGHLEVVRRLLEAGAGIENRGGADMTPLMNAALGGHGEVAQLLVEKGARITDDLLSSLQLKVKILEENADEGMVLPEGVQAWRAFLDLLDTKRLRQDLPELVGQLSSADAAVRTWALDRVEMAGYRGVEISAALPQLHELVGDPDGQVRQTAAAALCTQLVRRGDWDAVGALCKAGDEAVKGGVISVVVASARAKYEILPLVPTLLDLLVDPKASLRSDAAIALGYAATNGGDVTSAVPQLAARLSDAEADVRKMAAWALYRIAKYVGSIAAAAPALQALVADASEEVRDMAAEALRAEEGRADA